VHFGIECFIYIMLKRKKGNKEVYDSIKKKKKENVCVCVRVCAHAPLIRDKQHSTETEWADFGIQTQWAQILPPLLLCCVSHYPTAP
jgi:hypothetical protein